MKDVCISESRLLSSAHGGSDSAFELGKDKKVFNSGLLADVKPNSGNLLS